MAIHVKERDVECEGEISEALDRAAPYLHPVMSADVADGCSFLRVRQDNKLELGWRETCNAITCYGEREVVSGMCPSGMVMLERMVKVLWS